MKYKMTFHVTMTEGDAVYVSKVCAMNEAEAERLCVGAHPSKVVSGIAEYEGEDTWTPETCCVISTAKVSS